MCLKNLEERNEEPVLKALVTTSKALVTSSVALVTTSVALVLKGSIPKHTGNHQIVILGHSTEGA